MVGVLSIRRWQRLVFGVIVLVSERHIVRHLEGCRTCIWNCLDPRLGFFFRQAVAGRDLLLRNHSLGDSLS